MHLSRREVCSLLPFAMMTRSWASADSPLLSHVFLFKDLPVKRNPGSEIRSVLRGATPTGEQVEVHETVLEPGAGPHPPHRHEHSEFWLIREGTVEITINGTPHQIGPGSVAFAASNDEHGIRNVGDIPASYFVVAIGAQKPGDNTKQKK